jgi:hypothetical protein
MTKIVINSTSMIVGKNVPERATSSSLPSPGHAIAGGDVPLFEFAKLLS